jgi:SAM-dependent methyltransferase
MAPRSGSEAPYEPGDDRSLERLREHWEIERELADRLRRADRAERASLYGSVYDELFRRVPDHPQLKKRTTPEARRAAAARRAEMIHGFLGPGRGFLEIGAGDCAVSLAMCPLGRRVYAVEVSAEIATIDEPPPNFELLLTDGQRIPVPPGSIDLAYSNQLMEHLHPDDAEQQLGEIVRALTPGGRYLCLTPNRLLGPSDISSHFEDEVASGFHLREYSNRELRDVALAAGFASVSIIAVLRGRMYALPMAPFLAFEWLFARLPLSLRGRLKRHRVVAKLISPGGGVLARRA